MALNGSYPCYQYPDLTELVSMTSILTPADLTTEFAFWVSAPYSGAAITRKEAEKIGFKSVSSMNNWYPAHCSEPRELQLFWRKNPGVAELREDAHRVFWGTSANHLAAGGCGFKLGCLPLVKKEYFQFFTLMRMPIKPSAVQIRLLKKLNFRYLDTGSLASYWVNGWPPEEYSAKKEYEFFGTTFEQWKITCRGY